MAVSTAQGVVRLDKNHFFQMMLRNDFKNVIIETLRDENTLLGKMMRASKTKHYGKVREWRTHVGRSTGNNAIGMQGRLPDPGEQRYGKSFASFRSLRARILVDQLLSSISSSAIAAWAESIGSEMKRLVDDNSVLMNRMLHGDGSGVVGAVSGWAGPTALTCGGLSATTLGYEGLSYMPNFEPTMWLRAGKSYVTITPAALVGTDSSPFSGDSISSKFVLASIDSTTGATVQSGTLTGTPLVGDYIAECSSIDWPQTNETLADLLATTPRMKDTAFRREIMGIGGFASDNNLGRSYSFEDEGMDVKNGFQGQAVAGNDWNKAIVDAPAGGRPITSRLLHRTIANYHKKNKKKPTQAICSYEVANAMYEMLVNERLFVQSGAASPSFNGEVDNFDLNWGGINFTPDRDCLPHRITFWRPEAIEWLMVREWEWLDKDGSMFSRLENEEKYQATMVWDGNPFTKMRREFMLLASLQEA